MSPAGESPARVHATVWGVNTAQARAGAADVITHRWPGAEDFDVRSLNLIESKAPCPLDLEHHIVLASRRGKGWAWILHDPALPPPLLAFDQERTCVCLDASGAEL